MKIIKKIILLLMILCASVFMGCGSTPESDDSEYTDNMKYPLEGYTYELSRVIDRHIDERTGEIITKKAIEKYVTKECLNVKLKDGDSLRHVYAIMNYDYREEEEVTLSESNVEGFLYYVIFDSGIVSRVIVDKEIVEDDSNPPQILEEYIMCIENLKQGYHWTSPNGFYSIVDRYEYVALQYFSKTAPSFKISTYRHEGDDEPLYIYWWCPEIGWFVQSQNYVDLNYYVLETISFEWEED